MGSNNKVCFNVSELGADIVSFMYFGQMTLKNSKLRSILNGDKQKLDEAWQREIFANAFPVDYSPPNGFHFEVDDFFDPVQVL